MTAAMQLAHGASLIASRVRLHRAHRNAGAAQQTCLRRVLARSAGSRYAKERGIDATTDYGTFQNRVPVVGYHDIAEHCEAIAHGATGVLTREPVVMMERTSGSTAAAKSIPFTRAMLREVAAAASPWLLDLIREFPGLIGTKSYWALSPAARRERRTPGGIPIGIDDTEYFGPVGRLLAAAVMAVPPHVGRLENIDRWRDDTCQALVACAQLGLLSVWSPTFLSLLMTHIERRLDALLGPLPRARRAAIERRNAAGAPLGEALWPMLQVISCWRDGEAAPHARRLGRWFRSTPMQSKGLMATEGVVSIPLRGGADPVVAVHGHFLEFIDLHDNTVVLATELRPGADYSPVLSTSAGFLRYHLPDVVRCTGHRGELATLRFIGRLDGTSDLCGEKLAPRHVAQALGEVAAARGMTPAFSMLTPVRSEPPYYAWLLEPDHAIDMAATANDADRALKTNPHYAYCRRLGQLGPLRVHLVRNGWATYVEESSARRGARLADVKPSPLDARLDWVDVFAAREKA